MAKRKTNIDRMFEIMYDCQTSIEAHTLASLAKNLADKRFPQVTLKVRKGGKDVRTSDPETKSYL